MMGQEVPNLTIFQLIGSSSEGNNEFTEYRKSLVLSYFGIIISSLCEDTIEVTEAGGPWSYLVLEVFIGS